MNLKYKTKSKGDEEKEVRVTFDPPLSGYEEVKPRLLSMTADAQEALGMVSKDRKQSSCEKNIVALIFPEMIND